MKKGQVFSVFVFFLDDEDQQHERIFRKFYTRNSRRKSEGAFFNISQELGMEEMFLLKS